MNLRAELARVLVACIALLGVALGQRATEGAVAKEWRIRALALGSERIELDSTGAWTEQLVRLEALRRRLELGRGGALVAEDRTRLIELLQHDAPNLRAAALACLELVASSEWDAATIVKLAGDPLPEVRMRLCGAVPAHSWMESLPTLQRLARSDDEGVRSSARLALFGLDLDGEGRDAARGAQAELLEQVLVSEGVRAYLFEVERWSRVPRASNCRLPLRDAERLFRELDESGSALRAARALWLVASQAPLDAAGAKVVAEGWGLPLDPAWGSVHRMQQRLMLAAARRSGEVLAAELIVAIERASQTEPSLDRELLFESLFEGVLEAASTQWISPRLEDLGLDEVELISFFSVADTSEARFDPALLTSWLAEAHSLELRVLLSEILVSVFARTESAEALVALVQLLPDAEPEVRQIAIQALSGSSAEIVNAIGPQFFEAWQRLGETEGLAFLRRLPRESSLPEFRSTLLALGGDASLRRAHPSILELLGKFEGDEECSARLSLWLEEDVALLSKKPTASDFQSVEIAARGGVRALHSVAGEDAVPQLESALSRTLQVSMDVAKTCAWCLGRTQSGLSALEIYLSEEVPTRVRVEAALALARRGKGAVREQASSVLVERYETCDDELRGRILAVFVASDEDVGRELAQRVFADVGSSYGEAAQALEISRAWFERDPSDINFVWFGRHIELAQNQETRRLVIEAHGELRDRRIRGTLEDRLGRRPDALGAERQELLVALARVAPESPRLWTELWRVPLESATARLKERFRGKISAAVAFSFRGEIQALEEIVKAGIWPAQGAPELVCLDGQLALAMAESCRAAGDDEHATTFERIAIVALAGELPNEKARLAELRARVRLWRSAETHGRLFETARLAERLHEDWVSGELSERDLETLFGSLDPTAGVDPLAHLAASSRQARSRMAARNGEIERARELCAEARGLLGHSAAARRNQEVLERDQR